MQALGLCRYRCSGADGNGTLSFTVSAILGHQNVVTKHVPLGIAPARHYGESPGNLQRWPLRNPFQSRARAAANRALELYASIGRFRKRTQHVHAPLGAVSANNGPRTGVRCEHLPCVNSHFVVATRVALAYTIVRTVEAFRLRGVLITIGTPRPICTHLHSKVRKTRYHERRTHADSQETQDFGWAEAPPRTLAGEGPLRSF